MPSWILVVLRAIGIRTVADVVPVATELVETVRDVVDPPEPGQPLPYTAVRDIQRQIASATSHKVLPPPTKPRQGAAPLPCRECGYATVPWAPSPEKHRWCSVCMEARPAAPGPGVAKAVDRTLITPPQGRRAAPPRPTPRKEPHK